MFPVKTFQLKEGGVTADFINALRAGEAHFKAHFFNFLLRLAAEEAKGIGKTVRIFPRVLVNQIAHLFHIFCEHLLIVFRFLPAHFRTAVPAAGNFVHVVSMVLNFRVRAVA